mmetsp:Transcript_30268/g.43261  ORF Transcript_30268/g.43261 Transcript_30268/m.43261 type:complete len:474 (+) Transcript_30268:423-1844(+)
MEPLTPYNNVNVITKPKLTSSAAALVDPNRHPCKLCLRSFKTDGGLVTHIKIVHSNIDPEISSTPADSTRAVSPVHADAKLTGEDSDSRIPNINNDSIPCNHKCLFCKQSFKFDSTNETSLTNTTESNATIDIPTMREDHADMETIQKLQKQNPKAYGCKLCGRSKPSITGLQHHLLSKHPQLFTSFMWKPTFVDDLQVEKAEQSSEALEKTEDTQDSADVDLPQETGATLVDKQEESIASNIVSQRSQEQVQTLVKDAAALPSKNHPTNGAPYFFDSHPEEVTKIVETVDNDHKLSADLNTTQEDILKEKKELLKQMIIENSTLYPKSSNVFEKSNQMEENLEAANQLLNDVSKSVEKENIGIPKTTTETSTEETCNVLSPMGEDVKDDKYFSLKYDGAPFPCSKCKKICKSLVALRQHRLSKHGSENGSEEQIAAGSDGTSTEVPVFQCPHCDKKIKNEAGLHQHILMKHQ